MPILELLVSLAQAVGLILPTFLGIYLLLTPTQRISVQYMDMCHRYTRFRPLKDEDFKYLPTLIIGLRAFGLACLVLGGYVGYLLLVDKF